MSPATIFVIGALSILSAMALSVSLKQSEEAIAVRRVSNWPDYETSGEFYGGSSRRRDLEIVADQVARLGQSYERHIQQNPSVISINVADLDLPGTATPRLGLNVSANGNGAGIMFGLTGRHDAREVSRLINKALAVDRVGVSTGTTVLTSEGRALTLPVGVGVPAAGSLVMKLGAD